MKYLYNYFGQKAMPFIRLITLISTILVIWKLPILLMKLTCSDNELKNLERHDFEFTDTINVVHKESITNTFEKTYQKFKV